MSNNIKIELELPNFEKELSITVTLRKDGEAINVSPSITEIEEASGWKQKAKPSRQKSSTSNMMNEEF